MYQLKEKVPNLILIARPIETAQDLKKGIPVLVSKHKIENFVLVSKPKIERKKFLRLSQKVNRLRVGHCGEQRPKKETKLKTDLAAAAVIICGAVP